MSAAAVVKAWEACNKTDTLFILTCSVFCWPIIPAVGLGYSGYSTKRNSLASFMPSLLAISVCTIQWFLVGYTLAYGDTGTVFGDLNNAFLWGVLAEPVGGIPALLFSEFQLIFCATVCAIAVGGACERGRMVALIPFIFVSRFCLSKLIILTGPALGNLHLLPDGTHGLVRDRLAREFGCPRLCWRNACTYLQRCHCDSAIPLPLLPTLPIQEVCHQNPDASCAPPPRQHTMPAHSSRHNLGLVASFRCRHHTLSKLQERHGILCNQPMRQCRSHYLGLYHVFRDREMEFR